MKSEQIAILNFLEQNVMNIVLTIITLQNEKILFRLR
mgnify:CR=1 FL=1